jgi:hypothetical protein
MNRSYCLTCLALAVVIGANAQSKIDIGELDPPALDGLKGEIGCVAYHLDSVCEYVLGYVVDGLRTVVVLKEFQRRLESGKAQYVILDVVEVPEQLARILRVAGCRYDGDEKRPIVTAVSATGAPGDWVGPADWVVVADFAAKELVTGDPQSVECWIER